MIYDIFNIHNLILVGVYHQLDLIFIQPFQRPFCWPPGELNGRQKACALCGATFFFQLAAPAYRGSKPAKWSSWKVSQKPRFSTENLQTLVFVFPFYPSWRYRNGMTHATAPGQQKVWWTVGFLAALSAEGQHDSSTNWQNVSNLGCSSFLNDVFHHVFQAIFQQSPQVGVRATHGVVESGRWAFCVDFWGLPFFGSLV